MMRKVEIDEPGDTRFLEQQVVDKQEFMEENDRIWGKKVVVDAGDSQNLQPGQIVTARKLRDENSMLKRRDLKPVEVRDAIPATSTQICKVSPVPLWELRVSCLLHHSRKQRKF